MNVYDVYVRGQWKRQLVCHDLTDAKRIAEELFGVIGTTVRYAYSLRQECAAWAQF